MENEFYDNYEELNEIETKDFEEIDSMQRDERVDRRNNRRDNEYQQRFRRPGFTRPPQGGPQGRPQGYPPIGVFPGETPTWNQGQQNLPSGPPPNITPRRSQTGPNLFAVDPGAIHRCRYRYTYIWLENGSGFWAWIMFVGRNSIAGYRWVGRGWMYFGLDLNRISEFVCF